MAIWKDLTAAFDLLDKDTPESDRDFLELIKRAKRDEDGVPSVKKAKVEKAEVFAVGSRPMPLPGVASQGTSTTPDSRPGSATSSGGASGAATGGPTPRPSAAADTQRFSNLFIPSSKPRNDKLKRKLAR